MCTSHLEKRANMSSSIQGRLPCSLLISPMGGTHKRLSRQKRNKSCYPSTGWVQRLYQVTDIQFCQRVHGLLPPLAYFEVTYCWDYQQQFPMILTLLDFLNVRSHFPVLTITLLALLWFFRLLISCINPSYLYNRVFLFSR